MTESAWFLVIGGDVVLVLAVFAAWFVRRSVDRQQASRLESI